MKLNSQEYAQAKLGELKPHPRNPRQGDVGAIYQSIEANGFYGAIVAQRSTGYILAGNHRYKAAAEAGAKIINMRPLVVKISPTTWPVFLTP